MWMFVGATTGVRRSQYGFFFLLPSIEDLRA